MHSTRDAVMWSSFRLPCHRIIQPRCKGCCNMAISRDAATNNIPGEHLQSAISIVARRLIRAVCTFYVYQNVFIVYREQLTDLLISNMMICPLIRLSASLRRLVFTGGPCQSFRIALTVELKPFGSTPDHRFETPIANNSRCQSSVTPWTSQGSHLTLLNSNPM